MAPPAPLNRFSVAPLATMTRRLADVAAGRAEPDRVVTGARVLSTYSERILSDREVWIAGGRIAAVKPAGSHRGGAARYDAAGGLIAPGLVDPHLHIESSMVTACAYAEAALVNGTTTIMCDSHEIGNVLDVDGVAWMLEDARAAPLNIYLTVPSTVPATTPAIETAGGDLTAAKIAGLFDAWPEAIGLGEKMDFVAVAEGDARAHAIIAAALARGRPVSGHIYGRDFVSAYAASGVTDTHEAIDADIADDLLEAGIWIFLRGGPPTTPWHSLPKAIGAVTEYGAAWKRVCCCTDDRDAEDLLAYGLDWVVREAVRVGIPKPAAWAMGSLHPATRYGLDGEIGGLGGGRRADLVLLDDDLVPRCTWYGGELVVEDRRPTPRLEAALEHPYRYPAPAYVTVHLPDPLPALVPPLPADRCTVNAIRTTLPGIELIHERVALVPGADWAETLSRHGLCHVAVIERHGLTRPPAAGVAHGLLSAFGLRRGAVASSVGHDSHNIIVAGLNEADMRVALDAIAQAQGGVCVVEDGRVVAFVPLPVAGLISDKRVGAVAEAVCVLKQAWARAGCTIPYMGFNLIPLSVIPQIRITDKGLVLVPEMRQVPLFEAA
ncbi:adenine deaminase C-terminal domain-containing protein [uncultured Methylobacterium sp.]|uniref:adenine deaminase C-terminal domain-containing protein n=1 Tax=uncultured Methylobacterium sp. TaxID=157278 RepID=UPI0035CC28D1